MTPPDVDLLIVGGGIQGATAFLSAASRGLSVLLVDREDFGAGASANSMKIAHGGLRYLQSLDLPRSLESWRERRRWLRLAPDIVRPQPFSLDLEGRGRAYRLLLGAGLALNDLFTLSRNDGVRQDARLPRSAFPVWFDALITDTERLLWSLVYTATARHAGRAIARPYTTVTAWERAEGRVVAVELDGRERVSVGTVLSCVGAHREGLPAVLSMNLVVPRLRLNESGVAIGLRHPADGRHVFAVPWGDTTIVGTMDRPYRGPAAHPIRFDAAWVDEALNWLAPVHPELAALERRHVRFVHAGLLPADRSGRAAADSPRIVEHADGVIDLIGVKWTTAFGLSERAVRRLLRRAGRPAGEPVRSIDDVARARADYVTRSGLGAVVARTGTVTIAIGDLRFAVDRLGAKHLTDVLLRRLPVATAGHPGSDVVRAVAEALVPMLGWSDQMRAAEIRAFDATWNFAGNVP